MNAPSQRQLLALIVLLAGALVGLALFWHPAEPGSALTPAADAPPPGDFVLRSAAGPLDTRSLRGNVVLLYFGYTYCPDICPTSLTAIAQGLELLKPEELGRVRTLFVSVDPERDSVERLKDYTAFFHPSIIGLTGTPPEIAAAARPYGAFYARQKVEGGAGYVVDHSAATYVIAPDGRLVATLPHGMRPADVAAEIRRWLPASPSPNAKGAS